MWKSREASENIVQLHPRPVGHQFPFIKMVEGTKLIAFYQVSKRLKLFRNKQRLGMRKTHTHTLGFPIELKVQGYSNALYEMT